MIERFVDTSGFAELADHTLQYHAQAVAAFDEIWNQGGRIVTTSLVLVELTALLTSPLRMPKPMQIEFLDDLCTDPSVEIARFDEQLEAAAWKLWQSHNDKQWTMVDCASFALMRQRGLREAITTDRHFEQAGFVRLLT